jgi:glycosyltransferase involved in cell wall biosynthesis
VAALAAARSISMRILYVRDINQVASIYASELRQRGHTVRVYQPDLSAGRAALPIKLALMPRRLFDLRHVVGDLSPRAFDIAHIHWASYGILGLLSHIPFIVECHGSDVRYRLQQPLLRAMLAPILRRAASVHCITPDLLPIVQTLRPDALFFPGPVATAQFAPPTEPRPQRPWTILLFTRLDPDKGPEIAIEGVMRFARRHPATRVQLLDWGPLSEEYRRLYGQRCEFLAPVAQHEVPRLIQGADVVVGQFKLGILSFCELQAMSCARPVIVSFRYPAAYLKPPPICHTHNAEEIDEQLESLFQHPEQCAAIGKQARDWVVNHHDARMLALRLEKHYQAILST